ncbi:MAG TPA: formate dehydrogenase accessory sulfurtransferase FdhD [Longimicrobiaceae bacterium]|nr:formate dehydrogenase accessory sulfurtransferase FdhD [Longimicrobiaceae bacterium]
MRRGSTSRRAVEEVALRGGGVERRRRRDSLATEEPLEIRLARGDEPPHRVSVTMRTPGSDFELAAGFLFTEGVVGDAREIAAIRYCVDPEVDGAQQYNVVSVVLAPGARFDPESLRRNFYATSSCGVCGKASIEAVRGGGCPAVAGDVEVPAETLLALPEKLREAQAVFERTGGLHAAALFTAGGELLRVREDVGRHNALDKLVGASLLAGELPLRDRVVLVSGRLSFELVQKAARAGAALLAGVSAPSSLAVELAEETGMTLVGFLREGRFNVYTGGERILAPAQPATGGRRP